MHLHRLILIGLGASLVGCSGFLNDAPITENFAIEEELTADEWAKIEDFWGGIDSDDNYCRWACDATYYRTTGWDTTLVSDCFLDVALLEDTGSADTGPKGPVVPLGATVTCSGVGTEEACP